MQLSKDKVYVGKQLGEETNTKTGIYSVLNSLVKRELVCADEPITLPFVNNKGVETMKEYKTYRLTEKGKTFKTNN